nr:TlpA disulfide reductase family protein [Nocardioides perillae]
MPLYLAALVVACAPTSSPLGGPGSRSDAATFVGPVDVPRAEPCSSLLSRPATPVEQGWTTVRLPCLTEEAEVEVAALGAVEGGPVVVNLWASWCTPCREEMPRLEQAAREAADDGVRFVGVATRDAPERSGEFLRSLGVTFPQLSDVSGDLLAELGVPGLPVTVAVAGGAVVGQHVGPASAQDLADLVNEALDAEVASEAATP